MAPSSARAPASLRKIEACSGRPHQGRHLFLLPIVFRLSFLVRTHQSRLSTARDEVSGLPGIRAALWVGNVLVGWNGPADTRGIDVGAAHELAVFKRDAERRPEARALSWRNVLPVQDGAAAAA